MGRDPSATSDGMGRADLALTMDRRGQTWRNINEERTSSQREELMC